MSRTAGPFGVGETVQFRWRPAGVPEEPSGHCGKGDNFLPTGSFEVEETVQFRWRPAVVLDFGFLTETAETKFSE